MVVMEQKWRITRSETLLKDHWVHLRADHCVTPAGIEISPYYVLSYPDWVHVVAITEFGCLVLVRQYRHAAGEFSLELPGGAVDPEDTNLEQAARRELEEETGFTASDLIWSRACIRTQRRTQTEYISFWHLMLCTISRKGLMSARTG